MNRRERRDLFFTVILMIIVGALIAASIEFLFSMSWILGFLAGLVLAFIDFYSGHKDGWSVSKKLLDKISS